MWVEVLCWIDHVGMLCGPITFLHQECSLRIMKHRFTTGCTFWHQPHEYKNQRGVLYIIFSQSVGETIILIINYFSDLIIVINNAYYLYFLNASVAHTIIILT